MRRGACPRREPREHEPVEEAVHRAWRRYRRSARAVGEFREVEHLRRRSLESAAGLSVPVKLSVATVVEQPSGSALPICPVCALKSYCVNVTVISVPVNAEPALPIAVTFMVPAVDA